MTRTLPSWPAVSLDYLFLLRKVRFVVLDLDHCQEEDCCPLRTRYESFAYQRLSLDVMPRICWVSGDRLNMVAGMEEWEAVDIV